MAWLPRLRGRSRKSSPCSTGSVMVNIKENNTPTGLARAEAEIDAAAERLSVSWVHPVSRQRAGMSQILQKLAHGRLHVVALEIKRSPRRIWGSR